MKSLFIIRVLANNASGNRAQIGFGAIYDNTFTTAESKALAKFTLPSGYSGAFCSYIKRLNVNDEELANISQVCNEQVVELKNTGNNQLNMLTLKVIKSGKEYGKSVYGFFSKKLTQADTTEINSLLQSGESLSSVVSVKLFGE